ncbi:uncharacterized protein LOC117120077 [Anneissia japonica]|uniref:uncharacterized protein LOC117120077 n=1 Tax=Anneissia japonica TaxID=1529436 RepID=UPI0014259347|nr:uncharacterized protein LOC117120077 [Anneissia japonica]
MEGRAITSKEIKNAMDQMKSGKATGSDNIAFELVNALDDFGIEKITEIANIVYNAENTENVPEEMLESIFIALPKESGTTVCERHRTISLMSHVTKIILRGVLNRIKEPIRENISDNSLAIDQEKGQEMQFYA